MQFNPTDKSNSIVADIDFLLFGNSETLNTDYSLIDRTRNVNISLDETVAELFKADPNFIWDDSIGESTTQLKQTGRKVTFIAALEVQDNQRELLGILPLGQSLMRAVLKVG